MSSPQPQCCPAVRFAGVPAPSRSRVPGRTTAAVALTGLLTALLAACSDDNSVSPVADQPPAVEIDRPADESVHLQGEPIGFEGTVEDPEDGPLSGEALVWTSDVEGELNTGTLFTRGDLSPGTHVITLVAADSDGQEGSASIGITVEELPPDAGLDLLPTDWRMLPGAEVRFRAEAHGEPVEAVTWLVEGIEGGSEELGAIDAEGVYRAPTSVPATNPVTVQAVTETELTGSAEVEVVSETEPIDVRWKEWRPRVVSVERTDSITFEVSVTGHPSAVQIDRDPFGTLLELEPVRSGTYGIRLDPDELLRGYPTGALHHFAGFLHLFDDGTRVFRGNVFLNVRDASVPSVTATRLADDVQATSHVVNIRWPDRLDDDSFPVQISRRFYDFHSDAYDFLAVVHPVDLFRGRSYFAVSNDVEGHGGTVFDRTPEHGSAGRLKGRIRFPLSSFFDLGLTAAVHEIGHRWMVFLDNEEFEGSGSHWPISSIARGVMGFSGFQGQGSPFPFEVVHVEGDTYELQCAEAGLEFNDLELYLMGLLPPEDVGEHVVFDDQAIVRDCGERGTASPLTIDDVLAVHGTRDPPVGEAQTDFRLATIVLSYGSLLDEDELAYFHHMAERGEAREELSFTSGFAFGTTKPFFLATGGRATLSTRIQP